VRRLLPHELALGALLVLTGARLVHAGGPAGPHALRFLLLLAAAAAVPSLPAWRWRLVACAIVVQGMFYVIRPVVDAIHPQRVDAYLALADLRLFGLNPNLALERFGSPLLSDALSLFYLLAFLPYLAFAFVSYYRGESKDFRRFCAGLFTVYALGFLGYTLWPAVGPYAAMAGSFKGPLAGGVFTAAHHALVVRGTNGIDAFPSLHCALTGFVLAFDRSRAPRRFRLMLGPVAALWAATVYLRYHYVVDVAAGFAVAAVGLWAARQPGLRRASKSRSFCS